MSKRRVREKKENKQWSPVDEMSYYKTNTEHLLEYHLEQKKFWRIVKQYAKKTVSLKKAKRHYEHHGGGHAYAWIKNVQKEPKELAS